MGVAATPAMNAEQSANLKGVEVVSPGGNRRRVFATFSANFNSIRNLLDGSEFLTKRRSKKDLLWNETNGAGEVPQAGGQHNPDAPSQPQQVNADGSLDVSFRDLMHTSTSLSEASPRSSAFSMGSFFGKAHEKSRRSSFGKFEEIHWNPGSRHEANSTERGENPALADILEDPAERALNNIPGVADYDDSELSQFGTKDSRDQLLCAHLRRHLIETGESDSQRVTSPASSRRAPSPSSKGTRMRNDDQSVACHSRGSRREEDLSSSRRSVEQSPRRRSQYGTRGKDRASPGHGHGERKGSVSHGKRDDDATNTRLESTSPSKSDSLSPRRKQRSLSPRKRTASPRKIAVAAPGDVVVESPRKRGSGSPRKKRSEGRRSATKISHESPRKMTVDPPETSATPTKPPRRSPDSTRKASTTSSPRKTRSRSQSPSKRSHDTSRKSRPGSPTKRSNTSSRKQGAESPRKRQESPRRSKNASPRKSKNESPRKRPSESPRKRSTESSRKTVSESPRMGLAASLRLVQGSSAMTTPELPQSSSSPRKTPGRLTEAGQLLLGHLTRRFLMDLDDHKSPISTSRTS